LCLVHFFETFYFRLLPVLTIAWYWWANTNTEFSSTLRMFRTMLSESRCYASSENCQFTPFQCHV